MQTNSMIKFSLATLTYVLGMCISVYGQDSSGHVRRNIIKVFITDPLFSHPAYTLGFERDITQGFSVQPTVGYINNDIQQNTDQRNMRGYKIALEPHFYTKPFFTPNTASHKLLVGRVYIAPTPMFKYIKYTTDEILGIRCKDGKCDYYMLYPYQVAKEYYGGYILLGYQTFGRLSLDINTGAGLFEIKETIYNDISSVADATILELDPNKLDHLFDLETANINFSFSVRLGYSF